VSAASRLSHPEWWLGAQFEPLWREALVERERAKLVDTNRGARARLALHKILKRAGFDVGLVAIHAWTRRQQGDAYL